MATTPTGVLPKTIGAAADRGVGVALLVLALALIVALAVAAGPRLPALRTLVAAVGAGGVAVGVLVTMDGVLAI